MKILMKCLSFFMALIFITSLSGLQGCKQRLQTGESILTGIITDVEQQVPINKVQIIIKSSTSGVTYNTETDSQGRYQIACEKGYYSLVASKKNYLTYDRNIIIGKGTSQEDFYMSRLHETPCTLEGTVTDAANGKALEDASVQIGSNIVKTDKKGKYKLEKLPEGQYNSFISAPGYESLNELVKVTRGLNVSDFKLKKFEIKTGSADNKLKRNPEYAADPTFLDDFKATNKRILYPKKDYREYYVVVESRYIKYVKYNERNKIGEIVSTPNTLYKNLGKGWTKTLPIDTTSQPDDVVKFDLTTVLAFFNFADSDIVIEAKGTEKVNNYSTRIFHMYSKKGAPQAKDIDVTIWLITNNARLDLNNVLTRIKGKMTPDIAENIWAEIDLNFYDIGNKNKVTIPNL